MDRTDVVYVEYEDDVRSAGRRIDELRAKGITDINAEQQKDGIYRIEYREDKHESSGTAEHDA